MKNTTYKVKKVSIDRAEEIAALFKACTDVLIASGIDQWNYSYPLYDDIALDITNDELRAVLIEGCIAGVITMNEQQNKQYQDIKWNHISDRVCVMHRAAVHPDYQGRGIGHVLVEYADQYAMDHGYEVIRLDAYTKNPKSNGLYQAHGYVKADGFCYFHGNKVPFNCWEKKM